MKKFMKAAAAIMLTMAMVFAMGCNKPDDPNNPNNGSDENTKEYTIGVSAVTDVEGTVVGGGDFHYLDECTVEAIANDGYVFYYWSEDNEWVSSEAIYTFSVDRDRSIVAHFAMSSGDGHVYIDLGLPSGTLWATCNIGASKPEEYGGYFAWGETTPKTTYNWSTYKYCNGYNSSLSMLLPEDDAATVNWGEGWCMPTVDQWQELRDNTIYAWTTQVGVTGGLFTASNGRSLFLPAAGSLIIEELTSEGGCGDYWSSLLDTEDLDRMWVWGFGVRRYFNATGCLIYFNPWYGLSVRPVRSAR